MSRSNKYGIRLARNAPRASGHRISLRPLLHNCKGKEPPHRVQNEVVSLWPDFRTGRQEIIDYGAID